MDMQVYIAAFVTLFVIIDPIGLTPIFASLTQGLKTRARVIIGLTMIC